MTRIEATREHLNEAIQGEISAVETYLQALEKVDNDPEATVLQTIVQDHEEAVSALRDLVENEGGSVAQGSGVWGSFAQAVEGTAKLFGNKAAIKALKEGEEHGLNLYKDVISEDHLAPQAKSVIVNLLLPRTTKHIAMLDKLLAA